MDEGFCEFVLRRWDYGDGYCNECQKDWGIRKAENSETEDMNLRNHSVLIASGSLICNGRGSYHSSFMLCLYSLRGE